VGPPQKPDNQVVTRHAGAVRSSADEPDYRALATLRDGLEELQRFSERVSRDQGCTAAMYELLLGVKTARRGKGLDIGMVATALRIRHPSAAEMVRKADSRGFLTLDPDPDDGRRVLISLSDVGEKVVEAIAADQAEELRRLRAGFVSALDALG
jgi:DNA-binding MarR family transcriptional regulator